MALIPGTRIGPYEILDAIGAGGMGEVYHVRDVRLNREVALKVLPADLVSNVERRRRFVQEAQLASSLQHPHIVTIFDIGSSDAGEYLAMELVKGRPMTALISEKGLRLSDALRYGVQITDALEAAHAAGIVHRDLKPDNIMVTDQGQIKILDFGLATLNESALVNAADETRAVAPVVETGEGTILGTVAYMSPEQAEGRPVDARSDLFSFGAILYEMLSGRRAFKANSPPGTLAAVINLEPPALATVVPDIPPPVERLVSRCLRKDISRRAQHASDIKIALEELQDDVAASIPGHGMPPAAGTRRRRAWPVAMIAGLIIVGAITGATAIRHFASAPASPAAPPSSFVPVPLTSLPGSEAYPSFSPDASQIAFTWRREGATFTDVYVQMIGGTGTPLRLTNDEGEHLFPAWSPDGKVIALWHAADGAAPASPADLRLVLVSPLGGPEREVLEWNGIPGRIAWSPDSQWLALSPAGINTRRDDGITLVSANTGERIEWAHLDKAYAASIEPSFSPSGRRIAFIHPRGDFSSDLYVAEVGAGGRPAGPPTVVRNVGQSVRSPVWTADGEHLLVLTGATTSNGTIERVRVGGSGPSERISGLERASSFALSLDGKHLAISRGGGDSDIWRIDLQNPALSGPVARSTLHEEGADFSPDGKRIVFSSNRQGAREIWVSDVTGDNALALTQFGGPVPGSARWSPDGREIAFDGRPAGNSQIFVVSASGGAIRQLTHDSTENARPFWSRDGRWIYFASTRSGRSEIWRMAPDGSDPAQVTKAGAFLGAAARDNSSVFYAALSSSSINRIEPDGTGDRVVVRDVQSYLFTTTSGLWFWTGKRGEATHLQLLRSADNTIHDMATFDFRPGFVGLSVSGDERYVLVTHPDLSGTDLLVVNDFR
jgi:Tol biopolymer transport system component